MKTGIATMTLDYGRCPSWLFDRMRRLGRVIAIVIISQPSNFERLLMTKGVGAKTIRALSLIAEVVYGAKPSYEDPARYSFSFGGKDGTPYPVERETYDKTLTILERAVRKINLLHQYMV